MDQTTAGNMMRKTTQDAMQAISDGNIPEAMRLARIAVLSMARYDDSILYNRHVAALFPDIAMGRVVPNYEIPGSLIRRRDRQL